MIFRKPWLSLAHSSHGEYQYNSSKRNIKGYLDSRKIIKPSYLRTQKELWELPLHGCIRNGLLMCLKAFLECLEAIWVLFFEKTIKIPDLNTFSQSFDKSYGPQNRVEFQTLAELITKNKNSIQFGISAKVSHKSIFYGKITPRLFAPLEGT